MNENGRTAVIDSSQAPEDDKHLRLSHFRLVSRGLNKVASDVNELIRAVYRHDVDIDALKRRVRRGCRFSKSVGRTDSAAAAEESTSALAAELSQQSKRVDELLASVREHEEKIKRLEARIVAVESERTLC